MKILLNIPFFYLFYSRIKGGGASIPFILTTEWIPWIIVAGFFSNYNFIDSILYLFSCYLAFISIYEIGYIINDYYSIKFDENSLLKERAPIKTTRNTIKFWIFIRIIVFTTLCVFLPFGKYQEWYIFYLLLFIVFSLHNLIKNKELKVISFYWLAFLRFLGPVIFLLKFDFLNSLCFVAGTISVPYRLLSYLDGKELLAMKERKSLHFRVLYFIMPSIFSLLIYRYNYSSLYVALSIYFALNAFLFYSLEKLKIFKENNFSK